MANGNKSLEELKRQAAISAATQVESGMLLGLGTGSTSTYAVVSIGERYQNGELRDIAGVSTSRATTLLAQRYGIPLRELHEVSQLDLAIDGADEVDPACQLIKGGGGALLREKAVERCAARLVIVVDHTKLSPRLGTRFALPIELEQGRWRHARDTIATRGCEVVRREVANGPFVTDSGNYIVDARFPNGIERPEELARWLDEQPGVRAHGLFLDMADEVIVASASGITVRKVQ